MYFNIRYTTSNLHVCMESSVLESYLHLAYKFLTLISMADS